VNFVENKDFKSFFGNEIIDQVNKEKPLKEKVKRNLNPEEIILSIQSGTSIIILYEQEETSDVKESNRSLD
jgi:hypothetical protein